MQAEFYYSLLVTVVFGLVCFSVGRGYESMKRRHRQFVLELRLRELLQASGYVLRCHFMHDDYTLAAVAFKDATERLQVENWRDAMERAECTLEGHDGF